MCAEREEHRLVGGPAETSAALGDRDGAVERRDHVDQQPRAVGGAWTGFRGDEGLDVVDLCGVGPQPSHPARTYRWQADGRWSIHAAATAPPHRAPARRAAPLEPGGLAAGRGARCQRRRGVDGVPDRRAWPAPARRYTAVRTAGIAGLAAGALSMAVGEYVSVAVQRDIEQADLRIERQALAGAPGRRAAGAGADLGGARPRAGAGDGGGAAAHRRRRARRPTPATSSASPTDTAARPRAGRGHVGRLRSPSAPWCRCSPSSSPPTPGARPW